MALTGKRLDTRVFPTTIATFYTVPGSTKTRITEIIVCNAAAAGRTIRIHFVPSGGSADTSNAVAYDWSVPPGIPVPIPLNTWLNTGDLIRGVASAADVSCTISGIEET